MKLTYRCILFVIGVILLLLTFSSPLSPSTARSLQNSWQLGHIFLFAVWTYLLFPVVARRFPRPQALIIIIIVGTLLAGLLIEYLQTFIEREFSLRDLVYDLTGSLLTLCCFVINKTLPLHKWSRHLLYTVTALLGLYAVVPLASSLLDEIMMYRSFPLLADFNSRLEVKRWRGNVEIVELFSAKGTDKVLRVPLSTNYYSGISLSYFPRDWSRYRQLQFKLFNPAQSPVTMTIRIHDNKHYSLGKGDYDDRFNRRLEIGPGWNSFSVTLADIAEAPLHRTLDLSNVQSVGLFSTRLPKPRILYIDEFRLSK